MAEAITSNLRLLAQKMQHQFVIDEVERMLSEERFGLPKIQGYLIGAITRYIQSRNVSVEEVQELYDLLGLTPEEVKRVVRHITN